VVEPVGSSPAHESLVGVTGGRNGFEAYAADDHSLGLFLNPRKSVAAITATRPGSPEPS